MLTWLPVQGWHQNLSGSHLPNQILAPWESVCFQTHCHSRIKINI
jgi:hypothetical protein